MRAAANGTAVSLLVGRVLDRRKLQDQAQSEGKQTAGLRSHGETKSLQTTLPRFLQATVQRLLQAMCRSSARPLP